MTTAAVAQQAIVDQFEIRSYTLDGFTLPYRLFVPENYDPEVAYPLVLALHGAGERGTDNERHIRPHRLATSWADPANQAENPAFVVAPQVPPNERWSAEQPVDQSDFTNEELATLAILDSPAVEFNIDPNRVYITGLSMGGHG
ncbi:MAG TPA: alpha/beta hydrolase-fold protein, partial [Rhodothermales bacterium]|nr:alpha/beta hydrolase-fold protein [Rhodothermales bacterium]